MIGVNATNVDRESDAFKSCYVLVCHILTQAGYTEEQAKAAFENRIEFEKELISLSDKAEKEYDRTAMLTMDKAEELAGEFPVRKLAETRGYEAASEYDVHQADIVAAGQLYNEEHLNELKDYLICGYALQAADWLDEETFKLWMAYRLAYGYPNTILNPELNKTVGDKATNLVSDVITTPTGKAYMEAYDLELVKEFAVSLTNEAIETYKQLIGNCEWLSDTSKNSLIEKIDGVTIKVVYPDVWEDYSGLDLDGLDYYEARRAIWPDDLARNASYTGKETDVRMWYDPNILTGQAKYDSFSNSFIGDAAFLRDIRPYLAGGDIV